jgi:hypothetical protein
VYCYFGNTPLCSATAHTSTMATPAYYDRWDAFDVSEELRAVDEEEANDRLKLRVSSQFSSAAKANRFLRSLGESALSRADAAILKAGSSRRMGRRSAKAAAPEPVVEVPGVAARYREEANSMISAAEGADASLGAAADLIRLSASAGVWSPVCAALAGRGGGGPRGHLLPVERDARSAKLAMEVAMGKRGNEAFQYAGAGADDYEREFGKKGGPGVLLSPAHSDTVSLEEKHSLVHNLADQGSVLSDWRGRAALLRRLVEQCEDTDRRSRGVLDELQKMTAQTAEMSKPLSLWQRPSLRIASELAWREMQVRASVMAAGASVPSHGPGSGFVRLAKQRREHPDEESDGTSLPVSLSGAHAEEMSSSGDDDVDTMARMQGLDPVRPGDSLRETMPERRVRRVWRRMVRSQWRIASGVCLTAGQAHLLLGSLGQAVEAFKQGLLIDGHSAAGWVLRGKAFAVMGALAASELHFDRAIQLEGGEPEHVAAGLEIPCRFSSSLMAPGSELPWDLGSPQAAAMAVEALRKSRQEWADEALLSPPSWISLGKDSWQDHGPKVLSSGVVDHLLEDVLLSRSATSCKVLAMRALAATSEMSEAEWVCWDLVRALHIAARQSGRSLDFRAGPFSSWTALVRGLSGRDDGLVHDAALIELDQGRALFAETFVGSAARKFTAGLILANACSGAEHSLPTETCAKLWLNLSAALLRRASSGGSGLNVQTFRRALSCAANGLDELCEPPSVKPSSSEALDLPGQWLPIVVQAAMPRLKDPALSKSDAASLPALPPEPARDPSEQSAAVEVSLALARSLVRTGGEGHHLAVKALFRCSQALVECGKLRQAAGCLRGGLTLCGLWLKALKLSPGEGESDSFDAVTSARRLKTELTRIRRLAAVRGVW